MAKKRDEFGSIKLTQEELLRMQPKKTAPPAPAPRPQPTPPPAEPPRPPAGATPTATPALQPPARTPTATPALKPGGKPRPVAEKKAAEVCKLAELSDEAKPLLTPDLTVQAFVQALQGAGLLVDGVKALAFALPKREGVGWGLHCVKHFYGATPPKPAGGVFQAVQQWLGDQNDNHRRWAGEAAEAAGTVTPAGCIGMAVFFSGGSLAPPETPPVAPAPHLTHLMVANALQLASVQVEPEKAAEKLTQYIGDGLKLAGIVPDTDGTGKPAA